MKTTNDINEWLDKTPPYYTIKSDSYSLFQTRGECECSDGYRLGVQASEKHLCIPQSNCGPYDAVELTLTEYVDCLKSFIKIIELSFPRGHLVYQNVPVELVNDILIAHGGAVID